MMRLKTLFRALLDHHDRGISLNDNTIRDKTLYMLLDLVTSVCNKDDSEVDNLV